MQIIKPDLVVLFKDGKAIELGLERTNFRYGSEECSILIGSQQES